MVTDQQLIGFGVDHSSGGCAANALRMDGHRLCEIRVNRIQLVLASSRHVRSVIHHPELACPGNDRADPTLVVTVFVVGAILAVDADSNVNLNDILGVEIQDTVGAIREEMKKSANN